MHPKLRFSPRYGAAVGITVLLVSFLLVSLCMMLVDLRAGRCRSGQGESDQYEAEWVFAAAQEEIITNGLGDVVQPTDVENDWNHGAYLQTPIGCYAYDGVKSSIASGIKEFFFHETKKRKLLERYLSQSCGFDVSEVSNAFASVRYEMSGKYIPVVKVMVRSGDPDVAIGALSFLASEFSKSWKKEQDCIVDKAATEHWMEIQRMKKRGESIEAKLKEHEDLKKYLVKYLSIKMLTLVPPRVRKL